MAHFVPMYHSVELVRSFFVKEVVIRISQKSHENTCAGALRINEVLHLQLYQKE